MLTNDVLEMSTSLWGKGIHGEFTEERVSQAEDVRMHVRLKEIENGRTIKQTKANQFESS